jgi:hypothetical protein
LIRADSNELLFDVDQYGHHSDGRSDEERGDKPLTIIKKKHSNYSTWTILQRGVSREDCKELLDGFQRTGRGCYDTYQSPQYPEYSIKK